MKLYPQMLYALFFCLFSSFESLQPCKYAGSNITYVKSELERAIQRNELHLARFHMFKALGALEKSKEQIAECGCAEASERIQEATVLLKDGTKTASLTNTRILLEHVIQIIGEGIEILHEYEPHDDPDADASLQGNNAHTGSIINLENPAGMKLLKRKVDSSLIQYKASLRQVINTVDCEHARTFAMRIYKHCQQQLLREGLSEGKKYYNLRTEEITAEALGQLGDCGGKN